MSWIVKRVAASYAYLGSLEGHGPWRDLQREAYRFADPDEARAHARRIRTEWLDDARVVRLREDHWRAMREALAANDRAIQALEVTVCLLAEVVGRRGVPQSPNEQGEKR